MLSYIIIYLISILLGISMFFINQVEIFTNINFVFIILFLVLILLNLFSIIIMFKNRNKIKIEKKDLVLVLIYLIINCFAIISYFVYNSLVFLKGISIIYQIKLIFIPNIILCIYNIITFREKSLKKK